jgi:hypothetical protein
MATFVPPLLFQTMALGGLDGRLTLRTSDATCEVYFKRGRLVFARSSAQMGTIGSELVRLGLVSHEACEAAARDRARRRAGPRVGALLVERGLVRREDLEALIRERIKDAIFACCEWREGKFTFESGVDAADEDILLDMPLESLLLECMTRMDDARRTAGVDPDPH